MTPPPPRQRAPRQSRADLRALVLDAGVELLVEEGVEFRLDNLTFQRVFARIAESTGRRIVPAMVYERIWRNQEEYQWQVLERLIKLTGYDQSPTLLAISETVEAADLTSVATREQSLIEVCRIAGRADADKIQGSSQWWITVAAIGASSSQAEGPEESHIAPAVEESLREEVQTYSMVYRWIMHRLGFRMRAPFTVEDYVIAISGLAEGVGIRLRYLTEFQQNRAIDLGSGKEDWSLFAAGILAMKNLMAEPNPAFDNEAADRVTLENFIARDLRDH